MGHDLAMTSSSRKVTSSAAALVLAAALALAACGSEAPTAGPATSVAPSNDASVLHNVFDFPGQPQVLWTEEPLGAPQDDRAPGPTDYAYDAVLDYGDPTAVADLVAGLTPVPSLLSDVPPWYPPAVADAAEGAGVVVNVYTGVPGFGPQQEVGVVENEPRFVLLSRSTT